ncbi:adenylate isopentenyltransferase-like [Impatiens glandulifera]|uniref:adenylate isopentenyltransferase-like n=1 Tax=Impatiens glandulifera TaxID=253017 RepID=UPI001FB0EF3F|nr:adenylate isopentenyltransferase-like [Impatiens glandulifera]
MTVAFLSTIYRNYHKSLSIAPINRRRYSDNNNKKKIVVIIGPTGCGKSRLSIDLATRFIPAEVINSDKIQIYNGLDITTNKMTMQERRGVLHHLLGDFVPTDQKPEFTPSDFRSTVDSIISNITFRGKIPLIVGGSNSFIHALVTNDFHPEIDVFNETKQETICQELQYDCCFLKIDVSFPVLDRYLVNRVDEMMGSGMFEELAEFFKSEGFCSPPVGLRKAIGVPEFEDFFRKFGTDVMDIRVDEFVNRAYEKAVNEIKDNTCKLSRRQVRKILRLRNGGQWVMHNVETTAALRAATLRAATGAEDEVCLKETAMELWEKQVVEPSVKIVRRFLENEV